ncbi:hypothetical protein LINPERHAP1_LOCUS43632, partial [Linum perenne]
MGLSSRANGLTRDEKRLAPTTLGAKRVMG